ncbi:competence protein CoiA [Brevibacillus formosus]|uniref:competence protein CoiA n=2 Tax=Brevibacillus formosus TaxID=54913 RepID=UPI003F532CDD
MRAGEGMFVARTIAGYRVCTLEQSKNQLQALAKNGELMCPVCHEEVRYWSQTDTVRPHFKHKSKENCLEDKYGENETIEHQNGKYQLFKHMKGLYPESQVELEYRINETQQRSDVMVIHPNGEKWAIEFQCSPISKDDWSKRHQLYKSVGIKAFWILGMSVLQRNKEKKSPLENAIYQDNQRVLYLDALTEKVILHERFLYKFDGIHFDVSPDISITSDF